MLTMTINKIPNKNHNHKKILLNLLRVNQNHNIEVVLHKKFDI